jgi:phosphatidylinositol-binding clathrin assembly protein
MQPSQRNVCSVQFHESTHGPENVLLASSVPTPSAKPEAIVKQKSDSISTKHSLVDFFSAIEEEQPTMFNPQTNRYVFTPSSLFDVLSTRLSSPSGTYFQQQAAVNPFVLMQRTGQPFAAQPTGQPFAVQPTGQPFAVQPTGQPFAAQPTGQPFTVQPTGQPFAAQPTGQPFAAQPTGFQFPPTIPQQIPPQPNMFNAQPPQQQPFSSFLQQQATGIPRSAPVQSQPTLLQPQATGGPNPFRQSMMFPLATGMVNTGMNNSRPGVNPGQFQPLQGIVTDTTPSFASPMSSSAFSSPPYSGQFTTGKAIVRPASTPLTSPSRNPSFQQSPTMSPVRTHQTGSRNPFGPSPADLIPPVPKPPTLMELAAGLGPASNLNNGNPFGQQQLKAAEPFAGGGQGGGGVMAGVASSFLFTSNNKGDNQPSLDLGGTPAGVGAMPTGNAPTIGPSSPLQAQSTGFTGMKTFKPTSSFGAKLVESLPPLPDNAGTSQIQSPPGGAVSGK